jgi:biopolymer transport protein ExbB/TolQ
VTTPGAQRQHPQTDTGVIFLQWALLFTLLGFIAYLLWDNGIISAMIAADRTWLCLIIAILAVLASLHCGYRSLLLAYEQAVLACYQHSVAINQEHLLSRPSAVQDYLLNAQPGPHGDQRMLEAECLAEKLRGQHQVGWFISGLLIKLGLLGTVIGFGMMLASVGVLETLEISSLEKLMQQMTSGMGIALNTTLFGLVGSIILGLQYLFLDRTVDALIARTIDFRQQSDIQDYPQLRAVN